MGFESYLIEFLIERSMNLVKQNPSGSRVAMLRVTSPTRQPATCFPAGMADDFSDSIEQQEAQPLGSGAVQFLG